MIHNHFLDKTDPVESCNAFVEQKIAFCRVRKATKKMHFVYKIIDFVIE